ncbi:MAG: sigma 54-interacting transcriptional regulator, partial [Rhodospirillales bacterium]|nr:sigma 54-interacting transcriptional regulator [Rhodospirillales bacterium]
MQLLIIGTLDGQVGAASKIAMAQGAKVVHAVTVEDGLQALRAGKGGDLVLVDVALNVGDLINSLEAERIIVPVVACGVGNDTAAAVRAIKAGAKEYVPLPPNAELIGAVLAAISIEDHAIVYQGQAMEEVIRMAEQIAPSTASVLITGGSGTGKELMARFIHSHSKRKDGPFIAVNCAAIPDNLLESELFGHEKGAFTGAVSRRLGRFEEANGGTLLLDEISEMDPRLQAKLLRAIQEREIDRVGGAKPVKVDVRILA